MQISIPAIMCDQHGCTCYFHGEPGEKVSKNELLAAALNDGWEVRDATHYCPTCTVVRAERARYTRRVSVGSIN